MDDNLQKNILNDILSKSKEIISLSEKLKKYKNIIDYHLNIFDKTNQKLEEQKEEIESQEKFIYDSFLSEVEKKEFFNNPPDETIKSLVEESKSNKQKPI